MFGDFTSQFLPLPLPIFFGGGGSHFRFRDFFFGGLKNPDVFGTCQKLQASNLQRLQPHHLVAHHGISAAHDLLEPGDHGSCMQLLSCDVIRDGRFEDGVKMVKDIFLSNRVYNDIYIYKYIW